MDTLQTFNNVVFGSIRTLMIDDEPWFVGKDVALALEYKDTKNALKLHVDGEDKRGWQITTPGGAQTMTTINESGLYSLIFGSKLESAKRFKHWVTSEVLPALRKTGTYTMPRAEIAEQRDITRDDYLRAATTIALCRSERLLPIVMKLLESSGLEMPSIADVRIEPEKCFDRDTTGETARVINSAINDYGFTLRGIERLTGISATELSRIRKGISRPKKVRMRIIINAIRSEISKTESK